MANPEQLKILKQGVEVWNKWRGENHEVKANLREANLREADLREANLSGADLREANLSRANLDGANLREANLREANLREANLRRAELCRANLRRANLGGANLDGANLVQADLGGANLDGANLVQADLREAKLDGANLVQADLGGANLDGANLDGADLRGANLSRALLREADLRGANLSGANLGRAFLGGADLRGANLSRADLREADLGEADFREADLRGANLSKVHLFGTIFAFVDLSTVKGLDTCVHSGPSSLDTHTLIHSQKLPEVFLRGCGLPDTFIIYIPSLFQISPIQFYSCFISHSTKDYLFAERLFNDLQGQGVRTWYAPEEMKGGEKLYDQIDSAIRLHDKLLLVLSEHSLKSEWVLTEIRRCRKEEKREAKRKLFPIRLVDMEILQDWECFDADSGKDLAVEVREFFIPDFSHWKDHDSYKKAFDRLLRDLQESAEQEMSSD